MKKADLEALVMYNGKLYEVVGILEGQRFYTIQPYNNEKCKKCGKTEQITLGENGTTWRDEVDPVKTIGD